ncbi:MAG TPA: energy transducer TonB [Terriglobales bacterium]|nr:energy transducer TonB [Terriglobales bacterium]
MNHITRIFICAVLLSGLSLAEATARQLLREQLPEYPTVLKKMGIGGTVRVNALVSPDGTVKTATVQGGNPVLGELATGAVKKWKYAPSSQSSNEAVEVFFDSKVGIVRVK